MLLVCLSILSLSCEQSVLEKPVNPIDALDSDPIIFNLPEDVKISADLSSNVLLDHTADIFLFAEGLIELGHLSDEEFFTELGHGVMLKFYENKKNYTSYSFCDNSSHQEDQFPCREDEVYNNDIPYIGVALGVKDVAKHDSTYLHEEHNRSSYGEHHHADCDPNKHGEECDPNQHLTSETIAGLYFSSMKGVRDYIANVLLFERTLESIDPSLAKVGTDSDPDPLLILEKCFEVVQEFFEEIMSSIEDDTEVSVEIRDGVSSAIKEAREKIIVDFQGNLNRAIEQENKEGIINVFEDFFGIEDIDAISCPEDTSSTDINIHPLCESKELVEELQRLGELGSWSLGVTTWLGWSYGGILEKLANGINNYLPQVPRVIQNMIISQIEGQIHPDNIYNTIYSEAKQQAKQKIFKDKATLPGVEFSNVKMVREPNDIISFSIDEDSSPITNGLTLGTSMSALAERLKQMETYEGETYDISSNYQPLFSLFNKSLSMVGHYQLLNTNGDGITYKEFIPVSFFRPLRMTTDQTKEDSVNPYNYYGDEDDGKTQPGYFAIPERVILKDGTAFSVDLEATRRSRMLSTVASQAEMIRGASKILSYLRPDRLTSYDVTMGSLNLASDTDQEEEGDVSANGIDQALFPKASFFNLHLGIAGIVLTNLRRDGILIHTLEGESVLGNEFGEDQEGVTPLLVSVYDVIEGNQSGNNNDEVKTIDIARLMIAIEEFMLAVKDVDKINTPDLSEFSRKSYKTVSEGVDKLKEANLGFHFSMMIELQREDGCFVNSHNIVESHNAKSNGVEYHTQNDDKILLDTQVQVLLALTRFYKRSMEEAGPNGPQGGRLKRSILRGFNCITEKLFDDNHFYVVEEGTNQKPSLRLATDFLRLVYKLDVIIEGHDDWMQKLNDIRNDWTGVYIEQLESLKNALPIETGARISVFSLGD